MRTLSLKAALLLSTVATAMPVAAAAQPSSNWQVPAAGEQADPPQVEEVIVTGSRIARRDYIANSPITTVSEAAVELTGSVTIDTTLQQLPAFGGGHGQSTNSNGNGGQANIQLRGFGRQRTVVLLDGRRLPPANSDGSADVNTIPEALIGNIEVITGGASAVYGSDAIAGVVNFKLKRLDGLQFDAQYGTTERDDGQSAKVSISGGSDFADDRGRAVFSLSYSDRKEVTLVDREWTRGGALATTVPQGTVIFTPANAPSQAAVDQVFGRYGVAPGLVNRNSGFGFNSNGSLFSTGTAVRNYQGPTTEDEGFQIVGGLLNQSTRRYRLLQLPLTRYTAFAKIDYQLTDSVRAYGYLNYSDYSSSTQIQPTPAGSQALTVPVTNPFIPADFRALLASRPQPNAPFNVAKALDILGPRRSETQRTFSHILLGVAGEAPFRDWTWDAYASRGRYAAESTAFNTGSLRGLNTLINAPDGGVSACDGGLNLFGTLSVSDVSAKCRAIISGNPKITSIVEQTVVEASAQGGLFDLPAGELRAAVGATYRYDRNTSTPDSGAAAGDFILFSATPFAASTDVYEIYGEVLVPLLKDLPFVESLNATAGYRFSDYRDTGAVHAYKLDMDWTVVPSVRLRGSYQRAIRAPNLSEIGLDERGGLTPLGNPGSIGSGDPCDVRGAYRKGANAARVRELCIATGVSPLIVDIYTQSLASILTTIGGNDDLREEVANTYSAGVVFRPSFDHPLLANLSGSIDYFKIDLKGSVGTIRANTSLANCFNANGVSNPNYSADNFFCGLVRRNDTGQIQEGFETLQNLGGYSTSGIDFQADWRTDIGRFGAVSLNAVGTYLLDFKIATLPGDRAAEYAGTIGNNQVTPISLTHPRWKSTTTLSWDLDPVGLDLRWRYIDSMSNAANVGTTGTAKGVPSASYFDLNARWRATQAVTLAVGLQNLLDTDPVFFITPQANTDVATYDTLGRRYTVTLRARW